MALASPKQYEILDLAFFTARKIETESRNVQPNLRRLVLLSNVYDKCASNAAEMSNHEDDCLLFPAEEDLATANQSPSESYYSANDDPSLSEDSDEWDSDDSGPEMEESPPAYSLYTSPQVTVSVCECRASDDSDENDSSCDYVVANFYTFNQHDAKNPSCYSTNSLRDFSESSIPSWTQSENLKGPSAPQAAKDARGVLTAEQCRPVSSNEKSGISRLLHALRAIAT